MGHRRNNRLMFRQNDKTDKTDKFHMTDTAQPNLYLNYPLYKLDKLISKNCLQKVSQQLKLWLLEGRKSRAISTARL